MELAMKRMDGRYDTRAVEIVIGDSGGVWCIRERNETAEPGDFSGGYLESEYFVKASEFVGFLEPGEVADFKVKTLARCRANTWDKDSPDSLYWQEGWVRGKIKVDGEKLAECELEFTPTGPRQGVEGSGEDDLGPSEVFEGDQSGRIEAWLMEY
jgi:hypothetical protein